MTKQKTFAVRLITTAVLTAGCGDTIINVPEQKLAPAPNVVNIDQPSVQPDRDPVVCIRAIDGQNNDVAADFLVTRDDGNVEVEIPTVGNCLTISNLAANYTIIPLDVAGYVTPQKVETIQAGSLQRGDAGRTVVFLYRSSVDERCLVVKDQYGNIAIEARVNRAWLGDAGYVGNGTFCGIESADEEFTIELDSSRWELVSNHPNPVKLANSITEVVYRLRNSVNWCHFGVDPDRRPVREAKAQFNGTWGTTNCSAIEVSEPNRASINGTGYLQGSTVYRLPADVYRTRVGETIRVTRRLLWAEMRGKYLNVEAFPSNTTAEIFNGDFSIGFPFGRDQIVTELIPNSERPDVKGAEGADVRVFDVTETRNSQSSDKLNYVALVQSNLNWLLCSRAYSMYGSEGMDRYGNELDVKVTIGGIEQEYRQGRPACRAFPAMIEGPITMSCPERHGEMTADRTNFTVTSSTVQAGELRMVDCVYRDRPYGSQPPQSFSVEIRGPTVQNGAGTAWSPLSVPVNVRYSRSGGRVEMFTTSKVEGTLYSGDSIMIELSNLRGMTSPQRTMSYTYGSLPQAFFNAVSNRYEIVLEYTPTQDMALVCEDITDQNDQRLTPGPGIEFDGRQAHGIWNTLPCSYLTTNEIHQVWNWRPAGYGYGYPIIIPANQLRPNTLKVLRRQLVLEPRIVVICVETGPNVGQVEVRSTDRAEIVHTGWTDVAGRGTRESCFPLDVTRPYQVEITTVAGGRPQMSTVIIDSRSMYQQGNQYTIRWFP